MILSKVTYLTLKNMLDNQVLAVSEYGQPIMCRFNVATYSLRVDIAVYAVKAGTINTLLSLRLIEFRKRLKYGYFALNDNAKKLLSKEPVFKDDIVIL